MIKKNGVKPSFGKLFAAFSLIELMISLVIISMIAAAFTPVITKKLSSNSIGISSIAEIKEDCENGCSLCTKSYCINCPKTCSDKQYKDSKKCICVDCSVGCSSCNQNGCLTCDDGYYLESNTCSPCPSGKYCKNGEILENCPTGSYCDASGMHDCSLKFGIRCTSCNSNVCLSCASGYRLNNGTCERCRDYPNCWKCDENLNVCTSCDGVLTSSGRCYSCGAYISNCKYCTTDGSRCTQCAGTHFINSNGTCTKCELDNCLTCQNNQNARNPKCSKCAAGYILSDDGKCVSCNDKLSDSACVLCNNNTCIACKRGYALNGATGKCEKSEGYEFDCSDNNFMKIGNLCFTRKNMGDSAVLKIPNIITTVQAGEDYCYSKYTKCCWQGNTSTPSCNSPNGSYSGCNRTVCDWQAANEICKQFTFAGGGWRLPTNVEMQKYAENSTYGLGDDGLMLCQYNGAASGYSVCNTNYGCLGSYNGWGSQCGLFYVWTNIGDGMPRIFYLAHGGNIYYGTTYETSANSVRCVKEMDK